ncbi:transmembrane protein 200C-like [Phyllopteryx taeniolatus]|uniref:transmembrane protein 200C-like n=1 Tax=Phyllopteryx taeniolatus TaxID=161469 RepID=UPI002AD4ED13|nr:transmembrane protein 200C-like [Phyllopteryx taeniolatus]XP_061654413.1 transmembrane protein 200C-like [Phyllopteryx taeniolatus]
MIATGGLLRMNRRQDSLRSKNRAENKKKRKSRKKKKNDVVVVKGKLNLCSPAGLVAAVGLFVLMVGISMAVLGYWPSQNQQQYQERRRTGVHHGRMSYSQSPNASSDADRDPSKLLNQSHSTSGDLAPSHAHCGFLCDFLDNYLYSDNLKVFGPLVMGIGIFLFICANAVLHENRDKKTKIINLRDIYSTVIDLHSVRSKEYSPLNGLVNYTQSKSAEGSSGGHPAGCSSWPSSAGLGSDEVFRRPSRSWSKDVQTFTDTVYSIYKDYSNGSEEAPRPRQWDPTSIVTSSVNAFTLPVIKLNNCEAEEDVVIEAANNQEEAQGDGVKSSPPREDVPAAEPPQLFPPSPVARAMGSRLSLNSLADPPRSARRCSLSVTACHQSERGRRFSCPRLERSNSKGYIKLSDLGGESFDAPDASLGGDGEQEVAAMGAAAVEQGAQRDEGQATPSTSAES